MIELHRLKIARAVATHRSFAAAAAALGYTPSAVSQQVAALERELGTALFDRSGRVLRETEAGRVLLEHAERVLARMDAAELNLARLRDADAPLRLAAFPAAWHALMPAGVAALRATHGPLHLRLYESQPAPALDALAAGELDGALVFTPHPAVDAPVPPVPVFEEVLEEPFFAMLPPRHRLARRDALRLADLADERWVRPSESCFAAVAGACAFTPQIVFESRDFLAARGFVAAGAGIAVVPRCAVGPAGRDVVVRELVDAPTRRILLARPAGERPAWADTLRRALTPAAVAAPAAA
jgi:DNA-binding transcriptional LysR family regulator